MFDGLKRILKQGVANHSREFCSAVIVAAGKGSRMKSDTNKQFLEILDRPVLAYTLQAFEDCRLIHEIIIVTRQEEIMLCKELVDISELTKVSKIIIGGKERMDSVYNGLSEINSQATLVAVHDGARPLILPEQIEAVIEEASRTGAAAIGVKVKDTIKVVDEQNVIVNTPDRSKLMAIQTPQVFQVELLRDAYRKGYEMNIAATDDCMLVEQLGGSVKMVEGSYENIKITTPEDILLAEAIVDGRGAYLKNEE